MSLPMRVEAVRVNGVEEDQISVSVGSPEQGVTFLVSREECKRIGWWLIEQAEVLVVGSRHDT